MSGNKNNVSERNPDAWEDSAEDGRPTRNRTQTNHYGGPPSWDDLNIPGITDDGEETEHKNLEAPPNLIPPDPNIQPSERLDTLAP